MGSVGVALYYVMVTACVKFSICQNLSVAETSDFTDNIVVTYEQLIASDYNETNEGTAVTNGSFYIVIKEDINDDTRVTSQDVIEDLSEKNFQIVSVSMELNETEVQTTSGAY